MLTAQADYQKYHYSLALCLQSLFRIGMQLSRFDSKILEVEILLDEQPLQHYNEPLRMNNKMARATATEKLGDSIFKHVLWAILRTRDTICLTAPCYLRVVSTRYTLYICSITSGIEGKLIWNTLCLKYQCDQQISRFLAGRVRFKCGRSCSAKCVF